MRTGAAGHADGDRVLDAEQLEDSGRRDVAEETCHDDGRDGDGHHAAELFRKTHADGGGDGLRQQCDVLGVIKPERDAQNKHAAEARKHAGQNAADDGDRVLFEVHELFIQRDGKADGGGREHVLEENGARAVVCTVGVRLAIQVDVVIDAADEHEDDENHTGDEQRVQNGRLKALLNGAGEHIGDAGDEDAEKRGIRRNII